MRMKEGEQLETYADKRTRFDKSYDMRKYNAQQPEGMVTPKYLTT